MAFSDYQTTFHCPQTVTSWPDTNTPQMEIYRALLRNDFQPTAPQAPPNTGSPELFPDDPLSTHWKFGPSTLENWLPDSGATCHYTSLFSNLQDVKTCHILVSLADVTTKISTFKETTYCYFTTDEGQRSILGLTDVYFIEGLSHRLLSLTAISATQNFAVLIGNHATTICFPNNSKYTWLCSCMNCQHNKHFPPCHSLRMQYLVTPHSLLPLNNLLTLHSNLIPQDQQHHYLLRPYPVALHTRLSKILWPVSLHHAWKIHILSPAINHYT